MNQNGTVRKGTKDTRDAKAKRIKNTLAKQRSRKKQREQRDRMNAETMQLHYEESVPESGNQTREQSAAPSQTIVTQPLSVTEGTSRDQQILYGSGGQGLPQGVYDSQVPTDIGSADLSFLLNPAPAAPSPIPWSSPSSSSLVTHAPKSLEMQPTQDSTSIDPFTWLAGSEPANLTSMTPMAGKGDSLICELADLYTTAVGIQNVKTEQKFEKRMAAEEGKRDDLRSGRWNV